MALYYLRTKLIITFVLTSAIIIEIKSDSDISRNLDQSDDIRVPDGAFALQRNINDRQKEVDRDEDEDINIANLNTSREIEPERVFEENDDYDTRETKHASRDQEDPGNEKIDNPTTEYAPTTTEDVGDTADRLDDTGHNVFRNNNNRDDATTSLLDHVDVEDESTLSPGSKVYKHSDGTEDIYTNMSDGNNENGSRIEPTTVPVTTTRAMDEDDTPISPISRLPGLDDSEELDLSGQRNPKNDGSATRQPDKRNNDAKPRPPAHLSKSSTLKGWLEDAWLRPPAAVLVPLRPIALTRALAVWNDLTALDQLDVSDIVIVGYDFNGVTWRSRHNLHSLGNGNKAVTEALSKLLLKYQGIRGEGRSDGTMRALASAAKLVPYDSALFVVTDQGPGDPQRLPLALRALVEKRLKVYTIWTDPKYPSRESELELQGLKNISIHTDGDVLPYSLQVMDVDASANSAEQQSWHPINYTPPRKARLYTQMEHENYDILLVRRGGGGAISLGIPIENGVTALRVHIEGAVEHAVLYPPDNGPQIDLYNQSSVIAFSNTSRTDGLSPRDVFLGFPGADFNGDMLLVQPMTAMTSGEQAPTVGQWHLSIRCDTCDYRLCVSARAKIHFDAEIERDKLHLRVTGPAASVRESMLVDEHGTELAKLSFSYQPTAGDAQEDIDASDAELVTEVPLPNVKGSKIYAKIVGRDIRGKPFVRLSGPIIENSEVRLSRSAAIVFPDSLNDLERAEEANSRAYNSRLRVNDSNALSSNRAASQLVNQQGAILTAVQIGLSTRVYGAPGDSLQLHFEVTNYRNQAVSYNFGAVGELRFLRGISPTSQVIGAGQTVNVIVSLVITATAQPGARDLITFTAYNGITEQVSISSYVYVINPEYNPADVWAPEVRHNFQGTCIGRMGTDCANNVWSVTVIARDAIGGLLRLSSSPVGLMYESNFIAGTRDDVTATYRATCCAPRVLVTATDAYGNANSYAIDISNYYTEAAIAAIALAVFLIIALIVLIIFLIYWCVKRRKEARELPSYTTSRS